MESSFGSRLKQAWNVFRKEREPTLPSDYYGASSSIRPDRVRLTRRNERSIATSIFNRITLDVAAIDIRHCQMDDNGRFKEELSTGLNNCLSLGANLDQTSRAFIQDVVLSMFDEGCVAIVPVDTYGDPEFSESYDIETMRVGKIVEWFPDRVKVHVYNEQIGEKQDIVCLKKYTAIIENPLYSVINEPNSTMQRLIRKLSLLDVTDEQTASGKLDLIIQWP